MNYVQRFINNGEPITKAPISNLDLLDLKCMATGSSAAYRVFGAAKLNSIEVWSGNATGNAVNTIEVELATNNPNFGSMSKIFSDSAIGTANVAHVKAIPPRDSFSGAWLPTVGSTEYVLAYLTLPLGSIVDVNMTVDLIDEEAATPVTGTVSAATLGVLYTRSLDNHSSNVILPVGVLYI